MNKKTIIIALCVVAALAIILVGSYLNIRENEKSAQKAREKMLQDEKFEVPGGRIFGDRGMTFDEAVEKSESKTAEDIARIMMESQEDQYEDE